MVTLVEHVDLGARAGVADRDVGPAVAIPVPFVDHASDDRLGGAVLVEDPDRARTLRSEVLGNRSPKRLAADDDHLERQRLHCQPAQDLELARGGLEDRQAPVCCDPGERRHRVVGVHDGATPEDLREEQRGDRQIESERRVQRHDHRGLGHVGRRGEGEVVGEPAVRDRNPLRPARRTRGVEHVRDVVGADLHGVDRVGERRCDVVDDHGDVVDDHGEVGVGGDRVVSRRGIVGIEHDERGTTAKHPVDGDEDIETPREPYPHPGADRDAAFGQPSSDGVGPPVEFAGRHGSVVVFGDDVFGRLPQPPGDRHVDGLALVRIRARRVQTVHGRDVVIRGDLELADEPVGIGHGCVDRPAKVIRERAVGPVGAEAVVEVEFDGHSGAVVEGVDPDRVGRVDVARASPRRHGRQTCEVAVRDGLHVEHGIEGHVGHVRVARQAGDAEQFALDPLVAVAERLVEVDVDAHRVHRHQRTDHTGRHRPSPPVQRHAQRDGTATVQTRQCHRRGNGEHPECRHRRAEGSVPVVRFQE